MTKGKSQPPKPAPMPLSQAIRQAGTNNISKQEIKAITKDTGKSSAQLIQKLDQINQNLKAKDKVGINLSSGAANMLIREASKAAPGYDNFLGLGAPTFGTGKIGKTLQGMVGSRSTGGYINPQSGQQSRSAAVAPTFLARGMDLMPSGSQTVRGVGPQYVGPAPNAGLAPILKTGTGGTGTAPPRIPGPAPGPAPGTAPGTAPEPGPGPTPGPQDVPMTPEQMAEASSIAMGADIDANAPGWRRKQGSRARAGRGAQGLAGATRVNPFGAWKGGKG